LGSVSGFQKPMEGILMASRGKTKLSGRVGTHDAAKAWALLTWDDLDDWAGSRSVSRGQAYQRQGRVKDLAIAEDGRLLATVHGNERYVTTAWIVSGRGKRKQLESICSCPVEASGCKHAVAVVADYLAALADKREVPAAEQDDPRWARLAEDSDDVSDEFDQDVSTTTISTMRRAPTNRTRAG
jgi:uncharacterized Zn finger protein